jgi:biotin carboxyl carrier protein
VVIEAMTMQNVLKSPKKGTVQHIVVTESSNVNAGDVLVTIG